MSNSGQVFSAYIFGVGFGKKKVFVWTLKKLGHEC